MADKTLLRYREQWLKEKTLGQVTNQIGDKLKQIEILGGKPKFMNAGTETICKLHKELEERNEIAGSGDFTVLSPPDESTPRHQGLIVTEAFGEDTDFLSVTYTDIDGKQQEI